MKIRHPSLVKAIGLLGAACVRLWSSTVSLRYRPLGPPNEPGTPGLKGHYIYTTWHENLLLSASRFGRSNVSVLISEHADGRMIAEACRHLRYRVVDGSTTRGGIKAIRQMLRVGKKGHLAMTPDGPRGPRREVQPGIVYLASRTGLPIIPIGFGYQKAWRLPSWDRFVLPWPGSAATFVTSPPIHIPAEASKKELEEFRLIVHQELEHVREVAERLAAG